MAWRPLVPVYTAFRYEDASELPWLLDYILNVIWDGAEPEVQQDGTTVCYYDGRYAPNWSSELLVSTIRLGDWIYPSAYYAVTGDYIHENFSPPMPWPAEQSFDNNGDTATS